jgi:carbamoyltransferase
MNILGISAFYHDSAAVLLKDGKIVAAAQEERWSRKKHDAEFPLQAILYCLEEGNLTISQIDIIAFYERPWIKFKRLLTTYLDYAPVGISSYLPAMRVWIQKKLWIVHIIRRRLRYKGRLVFPEHHESHAASAFFPSPFRKAAILTMDGVGEWATTTFGIGTENQVTLDSEIRFPHSLGLLYSAFTYFIGFKVNTGEYKLMGLAPYGHPKYVDLIMDRLIHLKADGSFRLDMRYFNYCQGLTMTNGYFAHLFGGGPRKPESAITTREMDLAASIQKVAERVILHTANYVHHKTKQSNLVLAGGVALNCVANGRLLREGPFEKLWIQPASGDAGGALGAALYVSHQILKQTRASDEVNDFQSGSYLGPEFSDDQIESFLKSKNASYRRLNPSQLTRKTAKLIADGHVVGWFQGRMEYGPRALGARSILGDARNPNIQRTMNLKIKYRESFRPFAPSVLAEEAKHYFQIESESPYMLIVADIQPEMRLPVENEHKKYKGLDKLKVLRSRIPAVTHIDYSARIQTVHRETNPLYYELISQFKQLTGCAVIVNTSFNVRGEPIVRSPEEAYTCFMRTHMDHLTMGSYLLAKDEQPPWREKDDWRKRFDLD